VSSPPLYWRGRRNSWYVFDRETQSLFKAAASSEIAEFLTTQFRRARSEPRSTEVHRCRDHLFSCAKLLSVDFRVPDSSARQMRILSNCALGEIIFESFGVPPLRARTLECLRLDELQPVSVVVAALASFHPGTLTALSQACAGWNASLIPAILHENCLLIGPRLHGPCRTERLKEIYIRLGAASPDPLAFKQLCAQGGHWLENIAFQANDFLRVVAERLKDVATYARRLIDDSTGNTVYEIDLTSGRSTQAVILPIPKHCPPYKAVRPAASDINVSAVRPISHLLVNSRFGIIQKVQRLAPLAGEPTKLVGYTAKVADLRAFTGWHVDAIASGLSFSPSKSFGAAVGEGLERYCGNIPVKGGLSASMKALRRQGLKYVAPDDVITFTSQQLEDTRFGFLPPGPDEDMRWCWGRNNSFRNRDVLLPLGLVYLNTAMRLRRKGRPFHPVLLPGIAAGRSWKSAVQAALLEVIERDAVALWWIGGQPATRIEVLRDDRIRRQLGPGLDNLSIKLEWLLLDTDVDIPVVCCALKDARDSIFAMGFAARFAIRDAILKATAEAFQLRRLSLALLDRQSAFWRAVDSGRLNRLKLLPYNASREYATNKFGSMTQLIHNTQYYLDPSTHPIAQAITSGLTRRGSLTVKDVMPPLNLSALLLRCAQLGHDVYTVDVTTEDVASCGYHVARVIVPGACPNTATAYPPLGNARLLRAIRQHGKGYNIAPLPHA